MTGDGSSAPDWAEERGSLLPPSDPGTERGGDRGTSLIRNTPLLGSYRRTIPRVLWWSWWAGLSLMIEVTPYGGNSCCQGRSLAPGSTNRTPDAQKDAVHCYRPVVQVRCACISFSVSLFRSLSVSLSRWHANMHTHKRSTATDSWSKCVLIGKEL